MVGGEGNNPPVLVAPPLLSVPGSPAKQEPAAEVVIAGAVARRTAPARRAQAHAPSTQVQKPLYSVDNGGVPIKPAQSLFVRRPATADDEEDDDGDDGDDEGDDYDGDDGDDDAKEDDSEAKSEEEEEEKNDS